MMMGDVRRRLKRNGRCDFDLKLGPNNECRRMLDSE